MFWDDVKLVTELVEKYGLQKPLLDAGGLAHPCVADYERTLNTGDQRARYLNFSQRPFSHICSDYVILNPENGDAPIEALSSTHHNEYGCVLCLSVMEHVENPFDVMDGLYDITRKGGLVIISTVFSFPLHSSPRDYWRYSPDCLEMLARYASFNALESGWRLEIFGDAGIKDIHTGRAQEIRSVYIAMSKGGLAQGEMRKFVLPEPTQ